MPIPGHTPQPSRDPASAATPATSRARAPVKTTAPRGTGAHVTVCFPGANPLADIPCPHPAALCNALNAALHMPCIGGVEYSRTGQLVLHARAPFTAEHLAAQHDTLWTATRGLFGLAPTVPAPVFEPDTRWTKIVVHAAPLPIPDGSGDSLESIVKCDLCDSNQLDPAQIKQICWLCADGEVMCKFHATTTVSAQFVTVMIVLVNPTAANVLMCRGVFWQGAHCCTSTYKVRHCD